MSFPKNRGDRIRTIRKKAMGMDTERAAAIIDIKERALAVDRRHVLYPARLKIGWWIQKLWD